MIILSLDTSAKTATVALSEDGRLIAEYSLQTETHSSVLLPMIENMLKTKLLSVKDIGMFAASTGPGSFTGIRIGVSTVKGLAFTSGTPCVGVSSLHAMAMNFAGIDGIIVPVIDARRGMVYTALFKSDNQGEVERLTVDMQISVEELFVMLASYDGKIYFTGDAYDKVVIRDDKPRNSAYTPPKLREQSAAGVSAAAYNIWMAAEDKSVFRDASLSPVYLKKSQAEREREERLNNK